MVDNIKKLVNQMDDKASFVKEVSKELNMSYDYLLMNYFQSSWKIPQKHMANIVKLAQRWIYLEIEKKKYLLEETGFKNHKIKEILKDMEFNINVDYGNDSVLVSKKHGGFLFEFVLHYDKSFSNVISSSYTNPEEHSASVIGREVTDFLVYNYKNNIIDISYNETEEMTEIISCKLVDVVIN